MISESLGVAIVELDFDLERLLVVRPLAGNSKRSHLLKLARNSLHKQSNRLEVR